MSIGNLKDTGNQGNNLPYQWKVLQGLQAIYDEVKLPLTCVEDSIAICDANGDALNINANGSINSVIQNAAGTSVTTTTVGSDVGLDVNIINSLPLEVNLDPDNDSVGIYGYTNPANPATFTGIKVDAAGELQVDVLTTPGTFSEDSAHVSGNTGAFVLGVRNDSNTAMTSANGDYSPVAVNSAGAVAVQDGGNSITVDGGTGLLRTTGMIRPNNTSGNVNTAAATFYSVSVANVGSANGTVLASVTIKPGEVLNFSADAINNYFNSFAYDATGTEFIIIYVS